MHVPSIPELRTAWALSLLLALCGARPAAAQPCGTRDTPAPTLQAGQTVRGTLERADHTLAGDRFDGTDPCTGRPYDAYFYEAQAGERLTLVVDSRDIDPAVTATTRWRGGGGKDVVEQRGTRGRTLTATGTVPAAGRILIQVESNVSLGRPGSTGGYSITLRSDRAGAAPRREPAPPAGSTQLQAGRAVQGELTARSPRLSDESHYVDYGYTARAGERIVVTLSSSDFDAYLHVGRPAPGTELAGAVTDDDGAGGSNSRVEYTADRAGPVVIRANSLGKGETGRFTVELRSGAPEPRGDDKRPAPPAGSTLRLGNAMQGTLATGDRQISDGSFYEDFIYNARRGERFVVRLSSDDFDTVLAVGRMAPGGMESVVTDDDGGGGTNSRAEYTADRDGPVVVRVNALARGDAGRYTVVVERVR